MSGSPELAGPNQIHHALALYRQARPKNQPRKNNLRFHLHGKRRQRTVIKLRGGKNIDLPKRGRDAAAKDHEGLPSARRRSGCHASLRVVTQLRRRPRITPSLGSALVLTESLDSIPRHFCSNTLVTCLMPTFNACTTGGTVRNLNFICQRAAT